MNNFPRCWDSLQRGLMPGEKLKREFLYRTVISLTCNTYLMEKRKDLEGIHNLILSMDLAHNRLIVAFSENVAWIYNMNPPQCQLDKDEYEKMWIEWRKPGHTIPQGDARSPHCCIRFRKYDCGLFTVSGESGNIGLIDTRTLQNVSGLGVHCASVIYEHTFNPESEILIGAVALPNSVHIIDLRIGNTSQVLESPCGTLKSIAWSPRQDYKIVTANRRTDVFLWDIRQTRRFLIKKCFPRYNKSIFRMPELKFDDFGDHLIYYTSDGNLRSLDTDTLNQKYIIPNLFSFWENRRFQFDFQSRATPGIMFIPNGKSITVHRTDTGAQLSELHGHTFFTTKVLFNREKQELYSVGSDITPIIWGPASNLS